MNYGLVVKTVGKILWIEAALMSLSLLFAAKDGPRVWMGWVIAIGIVGLTGVVMSVIEQNNQHIRTIDGMAIVTIGWTLASLAGSLPYLLTGAITSPVDAVFEAVSGLSTTGATILVQVEHLPKSLLFWRSFTQWIGGMGILVFTLAFLPTMVGGSQTVFHAETSGGLNDRLTPRIRDNARLLYGIYGTLTFSLTLLLILAGMNGFEALLHAFGTVATAGFSTRTGGVAAFQNPAVHWIIAIFMLLSGVNFAVLIAVARKRWYRITHDSELKYYLSTIGLATLVLTGIFAAKPIGLAKALEHGFFQAVSFITTTGFTTVGLGAMPFTSQGLLFLLMFTGGCIGSTGSGVKAFRGLVVFKLVKREIVKLFHPRAVAPIIISGKKFNSESVHSVVSFIALYGLTFAIGALILTSQQTDLLKAFSASAAAIGNIGQSFGFTELSMNYSTYNPLSKITLSVLMLFGRLELFTVIALITPRSWKKGA